MRFRPTWRGLTVAGTAVAAVVMAGAFGARALNALAAPALVGLGIGVFQLVLADRPTVERVAPEPGSVDERREITLRVDTDRSVLATVEERVPDALSPDRTRFETTTGTTLAYRIEPDCRGVYDVGPALVTITDAFGLFIRQFRYAATTPVVVYPPVRPLSGPGRDDLSLLPEAGRAGQRREFDGIREYERGDALRDVHWKTSAKRPGDNLVVKQFAAGTDPEGVTLAATGDPRHADALASATASLAEYLLDASVAVGLVVADGSVPEGGGTDQRHRILDLLARTDGGTVTRRERERADVLIEADDNGIIVSATEGRATFDRLAGEAASSREVGSG